MRTLNWRKMMPVLAACSMIAIGAESHAQAFPQQHALTIVVPFPPGGTTDILARSMAEGIGRELKQTVIVDNRSGAGGNVGAEMVARAKPDGYTLLVTTAGPLSINQHLYKKLSYDPVKDFAPISMLATVPIMLVSNPAQPFKTVAELITYAKANPGKLTYGSQGNGTTSHLTMELLKSQAGIDLIHVPYRGSAPAATDLIGGTIQVMFDNSPSTLPFVEAGRMRGLGVATAQRVPEMKTLPAISETIKGFESTAWFAIVAPAGTPEAVIRQLNTAVNLTLGRADLQQMFIKSGVKLTGGEPQILARMITDESLKWGKVVQSAGVVLD